MYDLLLSVGNKFVLCREPPIFNTSTVIFIKLNTSVYLFIYLYFYTVILKIYLNNARVIIVFEIVHVTLVLKKMSHSCPDLYGSTSQLHQSDCAAG